MLLPPAQKVPRKLFVIWCWLYLTFGVVCLAVGIYIMLAVNQQHSGDRTHLDTVALSIGVMTMLFGLWRIALSLWHLRKLHLSRRPR